MTDGQTDGRGAARVISPSKSTSAGTGRRADDRSAPELGNRAPVVDDSGSWWLMESAN